jgi:hypothetical protein
MAEGGAEHLEGQVMLRKKERGDEKLVLLATSWAHHEGPPNSQMET